MIWTQWNTYATFRYDTVEMENGLNNAYEALIYFIRKVIATRPLSYHWTTLKIPNGYWFIDLAKI